MEKSKNGNGFLKFILWIVIIGLIVALVLAGYMVWSRLSSMKYEDIDKNNLSVNADLYDEVSDTVSKSDFNKVKTIALFGTDSRDTEDISAGRADTIMVASVNPSNKSIKLMSIPRDTYVKVEGHGKTKINHSYAYGKEELTIQTINQNFDLNIEEYATIDFSGLIHIINELGGVEVEITKEEMQYINSRVQEAYDVSKNKSKKLTEYGKVVLNGEEALTHSRNRTIGNDFVRASRQRAVLEALIQKMSHVDVFTFLSLSDDFLKEVKTNINPVEYIGIFTSFLVHKNEYLNNIESVQIPSNDYSAGKMIQGVYYYTTNYDKAKQDFITYIYEK